MLKLSTGADSTYKNYIALTKAFFGEESPAVKFLEARVVENGGNENEEVIAPELQLIQLLGMIHLRGIEEPIDPEIEPIK